MWLCKGVPTVITVAAESATTAASALTKNSLRATRSS